MSGESDYKCSTCGYEWSAIPPSKCAKCNPPPSALAPYSAYYRAEDGKEKIKDDVVKALDNWGWRDKRIERTDAQVYAFISGWESAMRSKS